MPFQWNVKLKFVDGKMKKWRKCRHHLSKEAFLGEDVVQLDQEGRDGGRVEGAFLQQGVFF